MHIRRVVLGFVAMALIESAFELPILSAQQPAVYAGQEVRAYNDSLRTVVSGRVFRVCAQALELVRYPDAPPTTVPWENVHRLEVKAQGVWAPVPLFRDTELVGDSTRAAGAFAGAAAGRSSEDVSYFWPAFLASAPLGYYGLIAFCSDCGHHPKVVAAGSVIAVALITRHSRTQATELPSSQEAEIRDKPPAYQAAYREAYTAAFSEKLEKQIIGGSLAGLVAGFGALVYAFATYGWN
jgi:hypothetical protein